MSTIALALLFSTIVSSAADHSSPNHATWKPDSNWSQFRGPNGCGIAETSSLPTEFSLDKNLKWMTPLSSGHSSPVLGSGKIFLTALENEELLTICLEQSTGKELWRKAAPRDRKETLDSRNHPASPSPVVDENRVYVFFPDFGLLAYTQEGDFVWEHKLGPFNNFYGMGASPIICAGRLVLICDQNVGSFIAAFDLATGNELWKVDRPEATSGHCTPIVYQPQSGDPQIIAIGSFYVTSYAPATGKKLWWVGGLCFEMKSTPVIGGDTLYINGYGSPMNEENEKYEIKNFAEVVASKDGDKDGLLNAKEMPDELATNFFPAVDLDNNAKLDEKEWQYFQQSIASKNSMMAIRLGGEGDMTGKNVLWKYFRNIPQLPSPVLYNDHLFMVSDQGIVTCLDPKTGEALHRGRLQGASGNFYASPVAADGKLFFITEEGLVAVTDASDTFKVLAVNDLHERCYATPAFDQNRVYIRTEKGLYAFGL